MTERLRAARAGRSTGRVGELLPGLEGRARRAELAAAFARAGGITAADAGRILWSVLTDLGAEADAAGASVLAALASAARDICEQTTQLDLPAARRDVLLLDDNEVTRDLVVMAIEARGHAVRVAETVDGFVRMFKQRRPDLILTEAEIDGVPLPKLCGLLRMTVAAHWVPVVVFATVAHPPAALAAHGIDLFVAKDQGLGSLIAALDQLFEEVMW